MFFGHLPTSTPVIKKMHADGRTERVRDRNNGASHGVQGLGDQAGTNTTHHNNSSNSGTSSGPSSGIGSGSSSGPGTSPGAGAVGLVHALSTLDLLLKSCSRAAVICPLLDVNRIKGSTNPTDISGGVSSGISSGVSSGVSDGVSDGVSGGASGGDSSHSKARETSSPSSPRHLHERSRPPFAAHLI